MYAYCALHFANSKQIAGDRRLFSTMQGKLAKLRKVPTVDKYKTTRPTRNSVNQKLKKNYFSK